MTDDLLPTRASLLSRLRDHSDDASWQEFFSAYWRLIYHTARRAGLNEAESQDVVQETIIRVSKDLPSFKYRPGGSFKGWLLRSAKWRIAEQFSKRAQKTVPLDNHADDYLETLPELRQANLDEIWDAEWEKNILEAALERVKRRTDLANYQIFELACLREWPAAKVANMLGVSATRVHMVKHRVSSILKQELKKLKDNPTFL